jgi:2-polyprenyl-3-methyl-5-hydroxy-6-metoxy-1,4-benzoquinol methylase
MTAAACIVCGGTLTPWFERLEREVFRCRTCRHIQVPAGVMRRADGLSIYEAEHADIFEGEGTIEYYLDEGSELAAEEKVAFVSRYADAGGILLDAGASFGHFLAAARTRFDAYGIELNPSAVAWSRSHFGVRNHVGSIYDIPEEIPRPLDVVTAWDVIEHLDEPERALRASRSHLKVGGWLFLSTPDAGSLAARVLGRRWHYQDPVQHVNLFSHRNLGTLLRRAGFAVHGHIYLGRSYRLNYVFHRLRYLLDKHPARRAIDAALRLPAAIRERHLRLKLFDVMALAARAV